MATILRLATRGPALIRTQVASVQGALAGRWLDVELIEVETTGDRIQDELIHRLSRTGTFVRASDERILDGEADAAVHSIKDMSTERPANLAVVDMPERAPAGDVLMTAEGHDIGNLPKGVIVGTSSLRRQAQLLNYRDNLEVELLRGNVDTRIERLLATYFQCEHETRVEGDKERQGKKDKTDHDEAFDKIADEWFEGLAEPKRQTLDQQVGTEYDAIVFVETGFKRGGLTKKVNYERPPRTTLVPVSGQGAIIVITVDSAVIGLVRDKLDYPWTRVETTVERTILTELGGGCIAPVGVHALLQGEHIHVDVRVLMADGSESIKTSRDLSVGNHVNAAREFTAVPYDRGVDQLVDAARKEAGEQDD